MRAASSVSNSCARPQADLGEAGEVLGGRVQDPLGRTDRLVQRGEVGAADGVDQPGAGALATDLHEVGALAVAVARGPLGVDRDRALAGRDGGSGAGQLTLGLDDEGDAVSRLVERNHQRGRGALGGGG